MSTRTLMRHDGTNGLRYFSHVIALFAPCEIATVTEQKVYQQLQRDLVKTAGNNCIGAGLNVGEEKELEDFSGMKLVRAWVATPDTDVLQKAKELGQAFYRNLPEQDFQIHTSKRTTICQFDVAFEKKDKEEITQFENKLCHYLERFPTFTLSTQEGREDSSPGIKCQQGRYTNSPTHWRQPYTIILEGGGSEVKRKLELLQRWISNRFKYTTLRKDDERNVGMARTWGYQELIGEKLTYTTDVAAAPRKPKI